MFLSQEQLYNLQELGQDENVGSPVIKLLRISRRRQQSIKPNVGPWNRMLACEAASGLKDGEYAKLTRF